MIKFIIWLFTWKQIEPPPRQALARRPDGKPAIRRTEKSVPIVQARRYDLASLCAMTLQQVQAQGRKGIQAPGINAAVAKQVAGEAGVASLLRDAHFSSLMVRAREVLRKDKRIGFNHKTKVWYPITGVRFYDLTFEEKPFLQANGLRAEDWKRISHEREAIRWIYETFTPAEFENFCVAMIKEHCKLSIVRTTKRPFSNADGGFDATGECVLEDGRIVPFALEAKRYGPKNQVTEDIGSKFIGSLVREGWKHGFIVTTGDFSDTLKKNLPRYEAQGIFLELIDRTALGDILLRQSDFEHGFGLHKTAIGNVYVSQKMLRAAARDPD